MKTLLILVLLFALACCGPPGIEPDAEESNTNEGTNVPSQNQATESDQSSCGISRCSHGSRARFPQPFNCFKFLESGHHGENVLLEKSCHRSQQFNPATCECKENFDCTTCTDRAAITGNAGERHYHLRLDMEEPHKIRCPTGEHFCDQSLHCVTDGGE